MSDDEWEEAMKPKLLTLVDELIGLAKDAREALKRVQPLDWTLLYGPRGTEIKRPGEP